MDETTAVSTVWRSAVRMARLSADQRALRSAALTVLRWAARTVVMTDVMRAEKTAQRSG